MPVWQAAEQHWWLAGADDSRHDRLRPEEGREQIQARSDQGGGRAGGRTSADYSPFEFHTQVDGQDTIVGIDISICQYIADQLGVQLKVVDMNFDNLVMGLKNGDFDIVSAA